MAPAPTTRQPDARNAAAREEIKLPLRGKALRDRIVLRIIASIARCTSSCWRARRSPFSLASHEIRVRDAFYRIVNAVQGTTGTPEQASGHGFLHTIEHIFTLKSSTLYLVAAAAAAYAVLEGVEAVGLWYQKRWAEYLTFVATVAFIPGRDLRAHADGSRRSRSSPSPSMSPSPSICSMAKRLFGLRGGGAAEEHERQRDVGWEALERSQPAA